MGIYSECLKNNLNVSVDYIAFTVTAPLSVVDVINFMGFSSNEFVDMPKGANGYKKQKRCHSNGISILFDGSSDMGIHVNVSGQGILSLLDSFRKKHSVPNPFNNMESVAPLQEYLVGYFFQEVLKIGQFTRIDIAVDDYGMNYYSPDEVFTLYQKNRIVSKWRSIRRNDSFNAPGTCSGYTLYFGSRESSLMLRIYDKKLEQNKNKNIDDESYIDFDWIRWELEFKSERANELAQQLIDGMSLGCVAVGVLHYYLRIIQLDDSNKSRCSNDEKWDRFIADIKKLRLCNHKVNKTIYDKASWIENQAGPTLGMLLALSGFDSDLLNDIARRNMHRISKNDRELIKEQRPDIYDMYFDEPGKYGYDNE